MLKPLFAFLALAAAPVAVAQAPVTPDAPDAPAPARDWQLAAADNGCMIHAGSSGGTVLSITASTDRDNLLFIVQNRQWDSLPDGAPYALDIEFDRLGPWQIQAVAQAELDQDGPGLIFVVRPGQEDGQRFMREFAAASIVEVGHGGTTLDSVPLGGSHAAMAGMARCIGEAMSQAGSITGLPADDEADFSSEEKPIGI